MATNVKAVSNWLEAIPDSEHPTTQGHILFLRNNPDIAYLFHESLKQTYITMHASSMSASASYRDIQVVFPAVDTEEGRATWPDRLFKQWNVVMFSEYCMGSALHRLLSIRTTPEIVNGYRKMLVDMFELRPELLVFFYKHVAFALRAKQKSEWFAAHRQVR